MNPAVLALFNHNPDEVLGRTTAGTLSLPIDARGLSYTITPPDTQLARDLIVSMRRKDITGSSFGFVIAAIEIEDSLDVSPLTYPAYTAADSQVRSLPESMPVEIRSWIEQRATARPASLVQHEGEWRADTAIRLQLTELG